MLAHPTELNMLLTTEESYIVQKEPQHFAIKHDVDPPMATGQPHLHIRGDGYQRRGHPGGIEGRKAGSADGGAAAEPQQAAP